MTERIIALLKEDPAVADYRINVTATESHELFFVHRKLETVRSTDTTDLKVTVFVAKEGKLGDATFSVYSSYSDEDIRREIGAACKKASLAVNEPYALALPLEDAEAHMDVRVREIIPKPLIDILCELFIVIGTGDIEIENIPFAMPRDTAVLSGIKMKNVGKGLEDPLRDGIPVDLGQKAELVYVRHHAVHLRLHMEPVDELAVFQEEAPRIKPGELVPLHG